MATTWNLVDVRETPATQTDEDRQNVPEVDQVSEGSQNKWSEPKERVEDGSGNEVANDRPTEAGDEKAAKEKEQAQSAAPEAPGASMPGAPGASTPEVPQVSYISTRVFDADYNILDRNVDEVHAQVLQVQRGESQEATPGGDLTLDLTWLLMGANPRTIGWDERQLLGFDFPVWRPNCETLERKLSIQ